MKVLLELRLDPSATRKDVRSKTSAKLDEIQVKVDQLLAMRKALQSLLDCCHGNGQAADCPILEALEAGPKKAVRKAQRKP